MTQEEFNNRIKDIEHETVMKNLDLFYDKLKGDVK